MFDDLKTGLAKNNKDRINAESYFDRYGKESRGFNTFTEFKDRSGYISRHIYELNLCGFNVTSNKKSVQF